MFPPKRMDSIEDSISALYDSLQRGGDQWGGEAVVRDFGDGRTRVALSLRFQLPGKAEKELRGYIKGYLGMCGWKVPSIRVAKRYVEIVVSNV